MRVLLCKPTFFDVRYAINPWMLGHQVHPENAIRQFDNLVAQYEQLGVDIDFLEPDPNLPDLVFTANAGLISHDIFVPSKFRYPERAAEATHFRQHFLKAGFRIHEIDSVHPVEAFEGAGDALAVGNQLIVAHGFRTSITAAGALRALLDDTQVLSVGLSNPYFYHLDTCLSPLPSGHFVFYPDAFDDRSRKELERLGGYWVTERFCMEYGCNMIVIGDTIVTSFADSRLHELARLEGLHITVLDVSEFKKAGGGVRCLSFFYE